MSETSIVLHGTVTTVTSGHGHRVVLLPRSLKLPERFVSAPAKISCVSTRLARSRLCRTVRSSG